MPEISRFYGIVIKMHWRDHNPPHFHAEYGGQEAVIEIESLMLRDGALPARSLGMVIEWAALHREELLAEWTLAKNQQPLPRIQPLP